ncbi:MAG: GntR family transcriptional regulator, partial [Abditibacteriota bacterium]|nr:GntR family transcriptional regulator [Abditibacteriota bacterium]
MSKYIELKKNIINYIKEKDLKPHDLIPSTKGLEELYNVSTITIRKAIDELVNEGVLY